MRKLREQKHGRWSRMWKNVIYFNRKSRNALFSMIQQDLGVCAFDAESQYADAAGN